MISKRSLCSAEHMQFSNARDEDRRRRIEAEANRFAALLLMPPPLLRHELQQIRRPDVADIVRLAQLFDVSKDALARAYVDYSREAVAIVVIRHGVVARAYRNPKHFPWLAVSRGALVPGESVFHTGATPPADGSVVEQCQTDLWLGEADARKVESLTEQVLHQQNGYALLMLHADLRDEEEQDQPHSSHRW